MRKNEYHSLDEFTSQYTGVWAPSDGQWFGLDFSFHGNEYRLHTGLMHSDDPSTLPDGREVLFGLYKNRNRSSKNPEYVLLGQFACMDELLNNAFIENIPFRDVIMDDNTELLGQD